MNVYLNRGILFSGLTAVAWMGFQVVSTCDGSSKVLPNGDGSYRMWHNCKPVSNSHLLPYGDGIYKSSYTDHLYLQDGSRLYPSTHHIRD